MSHADRGDPARAASTARAGHRAGTVLSLLGGLLALVALVVVLGGGLLRAALAGGADLPGVLDWVAGLTVSAVPGVILLFAVCALIPGEQLRRGSMYANPSPPKTVLPTASVRSRFRVLGAGWRLLWIVSGLAVSATLVGVPVASWFTGGWPAGLGERYDFAEYWMTYGSITFGVTAAAVASLVKKTAYDRAVRSGRMRADEPAAGARFWRWVDYRWRFDLWATGIGALVIALSPLAVAGDVGPGGSAYDLPAGLAAMGTALAVGVLLVILGLVASTQFWRAGESLGSGEGVS